MVNHEAITSGPSWRDVHLGQTTVNQENPNIFNQMIMMMYIFSSPIIGFTVVDSW